MGNRSIPAILREDNRREPVEGETFSSNPAHPYWRVRVRFTTGLKPSMERIRAATASQALEFVLARYPFACRSGSEVLGRWNAASAPIDHKAPVAKPVAKPAASAKSVPPPQSTPAPPPPMTKPILGITLKRLPRDPQGRALIDPASLPEVAQAHENGLSWPTIAFQLGCDERNLRERVVKWRKQQEARADAKEALQASVAERRQTGGLVPDGAHVAPEPAAEAAPASPELRAPQVVPQGVTVEELSQTLSCPPGSHGSSLIRANWLMSHPKIGPLLRGEHAPVRVVLSEEPPDPAYPPSFGRTSYFIGYRAAWAKAFAEVERQQSCSRTLSADQPTPSPVITRTKVGGFTVQITVNPVESGG